LSRGDDELASWFKQRPPADVVEAKPMEAVKVETVSGDLWTGAFLVAVEIAWMAALMVGAVFLIRLA
jgi:hypothetical protein